MSDDDGSPSMDTSGDDEPGEPPQKKHTGPRLFQGGKTQSNRDAGCMLLQELLILYSSGRLTAKKFCSLCKLCHEAGMEGGAFSHYAYDGENPGRHLSKLLPVDGEMVMLQIPANVNKSATRSKLDMYMRCLWSSLDHEVKDDQTILDMLNGIGGSNDKSVLDIPDYKCHPKTLEALQNGRPPPIPLALYLDGVAYVNQAAGRSETILGWWLINLLTGVRHFICGMKSGDMCCCGCRNWCSLHPVMTHITWMLAAIQEGRVPTQWPDGTEFQPQEGGLSPGSELSRKGILLYIKGDWSEFAHSLGLSGWLSKFSPCCFCTHTAEEIDEHGCDFCSPAPEWNLRSTRDYEASCARCEVHLRLKNQRELQALVCALKWTPGKDRIGGRVIGANITISGVDLCAGDRVEPSIALPDIADLAFLRLPATITLWRPRKSGSAVIDPCHHRCPLFSMSIHTSPVGSLAIDSLHTISLGVCQRAISAALWRVLLYNPNNLSGDLTKVLEMGIRYMKSDLDRFQRDAANNIDPSRWLQNLTLKMMQKRKGYTLQDLFLS